MNITRDRKIPWVIAQSGGGLFGLQCSNSREMVIMPDVCRVPGAPDYIRGVTNLRGRVTSLVDPHQRAFGRWHDSFRADNILLSGALRQFDAPYRRLHALAGQPEDLVESGRHEQALEILEQARTDVLRWTLDSETHSAILQVQAASKGGCAYA